MGWGEAHVSRERDQRYVLAALALARSCLVDHAPRCGCAVEHIDVAIDTVNRELTKH